MGQFDFRASAEGSIGDSGNYTAFAQDMNLKT